MGILEISFRIPLDSLAALTRGGAAREPGSQTNHFVFVVLFVFSVFSVFLNYRRTGVLIVFAMSLLSELSLTVCQASSAAHVLNGFCIFFTARASSTALLPRPSSLAPLLFTLKSIDFL